MTQPGEHNPSQPNPTGDSPQGDGQPASIPTTMPDGSVVNIDPQTVWGIGKTFSQYNADEVEPGLKNVRQSFGVGSESGTHDGDQAFGTHWWKIMGDSDIPANHALKMEKAVEALDAFVRTNRALANICSTASTAFPDADDLNAASLDELKTRGIDLENLNNNNHGGQQPI